MRSPNFFNIGKKVRQKKQGIKMVIGLFFILIILLSFVYLNNHIYSVNSSEEIFSTNNNDKPNTPIKNLNSASSTSMLQDPFTKNFEVTRNFFEKNYRTNLDFNIPTYYRYGDSDGDITDGTIFSEDNLFYYNSLMKMEISDTETFETYLDLKDTTLWYQGNKNEFKYGFVKSIDNITGEIKDNNRYLVDNVLPIFLLIENIGDNLEGILINGKTPVDSINEMFYLINSSEFWDNDPNFNGFFHYNSSIDSDAKYAESNFYAILANLLIHRTPNLDSSIRARAFELANLTMVDMVDKNYMWDQTDKAFYHRADRDWDTSPPTYENYYLSTNALGIITLLEFWIETGMKNDSNYYQNAVHLYRNLDIHLYDNGLYEKSAAPGWGSDDSTKDLKANAIMMRACVKLFEVTGNITYYKRALNIYNSIESNLYDDINNAYNYTLTNNTKSFQSNLELSKAYLDAFDIYGSTMLDTYYNVSGEVPNLIFNQDIMNLTSTYSYKKIIQFYNPDNSSYGHSTVSYIITNATFNYILKYPNGTSFYQTEDLIIDPMNSSTVIYPIEDMLPIGDGYYVYIWANTTYFKLTDAVRRFNIASGLIPDPIEGLPSTLYQGPIINVSLVINYTRYGDLSLKASLEGESIINYPAQEINFTASELIRISFNLTAKFGAPVGDSEIFFRIKKDNILYLEIKEVIKIGYSFDYNNFFYQSSVVKGDTIFLSMNLKNFLPNASQSLNVSFVGIGENSIENLIKEETLSENQLKIVSYYLQTLESIINNTIRIKMSILINTTEYYSTIFSVQVIPKFEILSVSFPDKMPQGSNVYLIIIIQNNLKNSEEFSLYINGVRFGTNLNELNSGENRIVAKITSSLNPYEFGLKKYRVVLKDSSNEDIALFYFEIELELSTLNLILFYILPIIIPIGIIIFFKNKEIKHKKLRR